MTYEERAEEYVKNIISIAPKMYDGHKKIIMKESYSDGYKDGYEQGRKEKWHDLRKDPNDLPKENGKYIIHIKVSEKRTITDTCDFFNGYFGQYIKPIAWCELPQFKE